MKYIQQKKGIQQSPTGALPAPGRKNSQAAGPPRSLQQNLSMCNSPTVRID